MSARSEALRGVRDQLPLLLGVLPVGVLFGALALAAEIPPLAAQAFSLLIFAGSAQLAALGLVTESAPAWLIVVTILIVNLRHMLYSANLASAYRRLPLRWRLALAWLLTDEAFATTSARYREPIGKMTHWYALGTGMTLWAAWQISTAAGLLVGARLPSSALLDFSLPLTFLALLVPGLRERDALITALTAAVLAVALSGLPLKLGLIAAALIAIAFGVVSGGQVRP